jgi:transcriptional regulator with XRE-family HTH domain
LSFRLSEIRKAKGLSQRALAERAGLRAATISDLENGKSVGIAFDTLERLASALEVLPDALFSNAPRKRPLAKRKKGR